MTTIYFIRHAEADQSIHEALTRPLTEKGMNDRALVTSYLSDKNIIAVYSSPYKRAVDTVSDFAELSGLRVMALDSFKEHDTVSDNYPSEEYFPFVRRYWEDFSYKISGDESLLDVQNRNITAINDILRDFKDKSIVIGTHGMALSTIINYYDKSYCFDDFLAMVNIKPWVVKMDFDDNGCMGMEKMDLFNPDQTHDYSKCEIRTSAFGSLRSYRFVVVFARFYDKSLNRTRWLYCRAKKRDTWETCGGHIEHGETPLDAAKRELYEETGAIKFDIEPAFDYSVHLPSVYSNGQVFLAQIHELGVIPDFEMAEVGFFDAIPEKMRFPEILPALYAKMQMWLNFQSAKDEIWDVYDSERNLMGRTHRRGDPMPEGDYHLVVHVWLQNIDGDYLISKRAPNKGFPNMWECTGGSAIAGDDSLAAAIREVKEELGLDLRAESGKRVLTLVGGGDICDVWLFKQDFDVRDVALQENETIDVKYASMSEIRQMIDDGEFCAFEYIGELTENKLLSR